jgi:HSP90 family molecular chaperone
MSEETTAAPAATETATAAPAATDTTTASESTATEAAKPFDMATWSAGGGARSELPEQMRALYDHMTDQAKKAESFNAIKELRSLIDAADQRASNSRQGVYDQQQTGEKSELEQQVQARLEQIKNQEAVTSFRSNFENMLKEPISVGDGHSYQFADKADLEKFVNFSRDVLQNGKISPMDLYKLYNFERILADTGEWKARQHEESLRKAALGGQSKSVETQKANSETESKASAGGRKPELTVEEIMKQKFPEIYGNMREGNVRFG